MRVLIALLVACSSSADYDCLELSKSVTQQRGPCRVDTARGGFLGCPIRAYCGPDGLREQCPGGWTIRCDEAGCTYGTDIGCQLGDGEAFDYVQTLNGKRGLGVQISGDRCAFELCD